MDLEKLIQKNKDEIREEESRKNQALVQFREWISKHPFISNGRQGKLNFMRINLTNFCKLPLPL